MVAALAALSACGGDDETIVIDVTGDAGVEAGPLVCSGSTKRCGEVCVALEDPAYGCGATTCTPCELPLGAVAACNEGACVLGGCEIGRADCNGEIADGCEIYTANDPLHCGDCDTVCAARPHADPECAGSKCSYFCNAGFDECNGAILDGCEAELAVDPENCGGCGNACDPGQTCAAGQCTGGCTDGFAECDGDPQTVCETDLETDPAHCSACAIACGTAHALADCVLGACVLTCDPGFDDCDGDAATGCEANLGADPQSCGACGHGCLGGACIAGACEPVVLASNESPFFGIAVDATTVFFTSGNAVRRVEKDGTGLSTVATGPCATRRVALDATRVYWTTCDKAMRSLKDGLLPQTRLTSAGAPYDLAIAGSTAYVGLNQAASVTKMGIDGTNAATFVAPPVPFVQDLAIDGSRLYLTTWSGSSVEAFDLVTAARTTLAATAGEAWGIDADAQYLYVADQGGQVLRVAKDGSGATAIATGQGGPSDVAADATDVYWLNAGSGQLMRRALAGGAPGELAAGPVGAAIALDGSAIYWVAGSEVLRLAK